MEDEKILNYLSKRVEKKTFWKIIIINVTILMAICGAILNLYILFYSGISDVKISVGIIEERVKNIDEKVNDIKQAFKNY